MSEINITNGVAEISDPGAGGSYNTAAPMYEAVEASKEGPVPVQFYEKNGSLALTKEAAEANPNGAMIPFGGTRSSLQSLLNAGLVARDPASGSYYDVRSAPPADGLADSALREEANPYDEQDDTQDPADEEDDALSGFEMSEQGAAALETVQGISEENPEAVDGFVTRLAAQGAGVLDDDQLMSDLNASTGMPKDEVKQTISAVVEEYTAAAAHAIRDYPVDAETVFEWAWREKPALASRMVHSQVAGDFTYHHEAAKTFLSTLPDIDRAAALGADLGPDAKAMEINGNVMVEIAGNRYTWIDALKLGGAL